MVWYQEALTDKLRFSLYLKLNTGMNVCFVDNNYFVWDFATSKQILCGLRFKKLGKFCNLKGKYTNLNTKLLVTETTTIDAISKETKTTNWDTVVISELWKTAWFGNESWDKPI